MSKEEIINDVANAYGISADVIRSKIRKRPVSDARAVACYLLSFLLKMSSTEIGKELNRDHSTVVVAIEKVDMWLSTPKINPTAVDVTVKVYNKYKDELKRLGYGFQ